MATTDEVWEFLLEFQQKSGRLAKLDDIREAHGQLGYRSSALHSVRTLVREGRVETLDEPGSPRRYRAVAEEGTDLTTRPLDEDDLVVHVIPAERVT